MRFEHLVSMIDYFFVCVIIGSNWWNWNWVWNWNWKSCL